MVLKLALTGFPGIEQVAHLTYEKNVPFFRWAMIKGLTETNLVAFFVPVGSVDFSVSTQSF